MEACGKSTSRNRGMKTLKIQCNVLKLALGLAKRHNNQVFAYKDHLRRNK